MRFIMYRDINNDKKIWFSQPNMLKMKVLLNGVNSVIAVDMSHLILGVSVVPSAPEEKLNIRGIDRRADVFIINRWKEDWTRYTAEYMKTIIPDDVTYPFYIHVGEGETATDEPADETIVFPPPETHEEFMERMWSRLRAITERAAVIRHEDPHMNALSENICREVPLDHDEVLRHTITSNLIKRPIGWVALQLETQQTRYTTHLENVVKANEAGTTPPTFAYDGERPKIEALLDKIDAGLTEECIKEHVDLHDHATWKTVQIDQRKITLCADDMTPGEVLVDVNSFFTDGRGNVAEEHAKKTYHDISTKYWVKARRTPHRTPVRVRTVSIS